MAKHQFKRIGFLRNNGHSKQTSMSPKWPSADTQADIPPLQTPEEPSLPIRQRASATGTQLLSSENASQQLQGKFSSTVEQDMVRLPDMQEPSFPFLHKGLDKLPMSLQHIIAVLLERAQDPEPEMSHTSRWKAEEAQILVWGWLPALTLTSTLGMLSMAH